MSVKKTTAGSLLEEIRVTGRAYVKFDQLHVLRKMLVAQERPVTAALTDGVAEIAATDKAIIVRTAAFEVIGVIAEKWPDRIGQTAWSRIGDSASGDANSHVRAVAHHIIVQCQTPSPARPGGHMTRAAPEYSKK